MTRRYAAVSPSAASAVPSAASAPSPASRTGWPSSSPPHATSSERQIIRARIPLGCQKPATAGRHGDLERAAGAHREALAIRAGRNVVQLGAWREGGRHAPALRAGGPGAAALDVQHHEELVAAGAALE